MLLAGGSPSVAFGRRREALWGRAAAASASAAPVGPLLRVPAYKGLAVKLENGQSLKVINTHGQQVRGQRRCSDIWVLWSAPCVPPQPPVQSSRAPRAG